MKSGWRSGLRLWLPALVFVLLNVGAYIAYSVLFAGESQARTTRLEATKQTLEDLESESASASSLVKRAAANQRRITRLYRDRFKTQEQRLTKMITEVRKLAKSAGLDPPTVRYPDQTIDDLGLVKRSIVFGVEGDYSSLRRFVNFMELSNSFLILEELTPSGQKQSSRRSVSSKLRIDLHVSTLFLNDGLDPESLARDRSAARLATDE